MTPQELGATPAHPVNPYITQAPGYMGKIIDLREERSYVHEGGLTIRQKLIIDLAVGVLAGGRAGLSDVKMVVLEATTEADELLEALSHVL
jgi:hypothetical protein